MLNPEQLKQDLRWLHTEHGMSMDTIHSLTEGPELARKSINFFRGMTFAFNGAVAMCALALLHYGVKHLIPFPNIRGLLALGVGALMLAIVTRVYTRQILAIKATERIARKHGLL